MTGVLCYGDLVSLQCELSVTEKWRRTFNTAPPGNITLTIALLPTPKVVADWQLAHFRMARITSYNCEKLLLQRTPAHSVQCAATQSRWRGRHFRWLRTVYADFE